MWRTVLVIAIIVLIVCAQLIASAPASGAAQKSLRALLNRDYVRAMAAYKRLERRVPREELRAITTIGIMSGAKQTEQQMEKYLVDVTKDLVLRMDTERRANVLPKIVEIEKRLERDQRALTILSSAMDLAMGVKGRGAFNDEMQLALQEERRKEINAEKLIDAGDSGEEHDIERRVSDLRQKILQQLNLMKNLVDKKIDNTLDYLIARADGDGLLAQASSKVVRKRDAIEEREEPARIRMIKSMLTEDDFRNNLIEKGFAKRIDQGDLLDDELDFDLNSKSVMERSGNSKSKTSSTSTTSTTTTTAVLAKQEDGSPEIQLEIDVSPGVEAEPEAPGGGGGGGLVGIISSLSGGEGGSDVGALIGALTGVISTLFGPGGLDIEALISTGTSLISGLLAGNKNFGTVLGNYVGTAFDGLSGGGGAINNGQFIGNFLGTVVASLSADPEDDDEPGKPFVFAQNLISSFMEAKNRKASAEESDERKGGTDNGNKGGAGVGGSNSGAFIKHIFSHLVGSALSFVLNASLGASGGASSASHSLLTGSSSSSHKPVAAATAGIKSCCAVSGAIAGCCNAPAQTLK